MTPQAGKSRSRICCTVGLSVLAAIHVTAAQPASAEEGPSQAQSKFHECVECAAASRLHRSVPHACVRAGDPHRIAWYARPSEHKRDSYGYVGGSTAWRGEPRCPDEGTWGRDYGGLFSKHHIWLKWLHGKPSKQPGGSYTTDGPHLLKH